MLFLVDFRDDYVVNCALIAWQTQGYSKRARQPVSLFLSYNELINC